MSEGIATLLQAISLVSLVGVGVYTVLQTIREQRARKQGTPRGR